MANLGDILTVPSAAASPAYPAVISTGGGSGFGDNGILSAVILSSLLGGRGFGRDGYADKDCVGVDGLNNLQNCIGNASVMEGIGDIKQAVPVAEGQVQLALAQAVQAITANDSSNTAAIQNVLSNIMLTNAHNTASITREITAVDNTVDRNGMMLLAAIKDDGEKTRNQFITTHIAELNRLASERQDEIIELRHNGARDRDRHGVEINMINNQNQNQLQFQQVQQNLNLLSHGLVDALQSIRATNQAINIGGTQTANPLNSNTNVKG
jgi:hypothetical protein